MLAPIPVQNKRVELAIEIRNLKKSYGDRRVVNGVTLEIFQGECFGLLGPNGAGKTTLLKTLSGAARPDEGELFVLGLSVQSSSREVKSRIGVIPQYDGLDPDLTVIENLVTFASYYGLAGATLYSQVHELLRMVAIEDRAHDRVENLSGGLRRRLAIVRAMINEPELLILDEPTVALDPQARLWIWNFLRDRKKENRTQILTTHSMEEAEALCDRIALMYKGQIVDLGKPQDVIHRHWGREVAEFVVARQDMPYYVNRLREKNLSYQVMGEKFLVGLSEGQTGQDVLSLVKSERFTLRKPDLNDVFLKLTGTDLKEGEQT